MHISDGVGVLPLSLTIGGYVAGAALAAIILAGLLATGGEDFLGAAKIAWIAHVPVIVIEGFVSVFTIGLLAKVKPEPLLPSCAVKKA